MLEGTSFEGEIIHYHTWLLSEALDYRLWPEDIGHLPLSTYRRFWAFQNIRSEDQSNNPAIGRENDLIVQILQSIFSED